MTFYTEAFRAHMVRKMLPPNPITANALAAEVGLHQATLSRRLKEARTVGVMDKPAKSWTTIEKLRVVVEASKLSNAALGEVLRREGIHEAQLKEWRLAAAVGFEPPRSNKKSFDAQKIKALEREVLRKDKALAEAAALIILKKKAEAIWGGMVDDTTDENEP